MDDKVLSLQLWDTAGQERFQSVTKAYYRGAHGVMLMYDVSQEESFIAVKSWINSIQVCKLHSQACAIFSYTKCHARDLRSCTCIAKFIMCSYTCNSALHRS